jgi:hypothetical protein
VGGAFDQKLIVIEKDAHGRIRREPAGNILFVPLRQGKP